MYPLVANTSYWVYLVCRDVEGGWLASDTINFTTGNNPRVLALEPAFKMYCSESTVVLLKWSFRNCESS